MGASGIGLGDEGAGAPAAGGAELFAQLGTGLGAGGAAGAGAAGADGGAGGGPNWPIPVP